MKDDDPAIRPERLLFRLAVGGAMLGLEGVSLALRELDRAASSCEVSPLSGSTPAWAPAEPAAVELPPIDPTKLRLRHAVIGALMAAPPRLRSATARTRARAALAWRVAARGARQAAAWLPSGGAVTGGVARARAAAERRIASWAELGAREEEAGRALARAAVQSVVEGVGAAIADSPELRRVVAEQSAGLTQSTLSQIRDRSERADDTVENFARRVLGRRGRAGRGQGSGSGAGRP
jgi:hypothetical protein